MLVVVGEWADWFRIGIRIEFMKRSAWFVSMTTFNLIQFKELRVTVRLCGKKNVFFAQMKKTYKKSSPRSWPTFEEEVDIICYDFLRLYTGFVVSKKIMVPPNHPLLIGFSIIFTIHFGTHILDGGNSHIFWNYLPRTFGEDGPILTSIFFKGVGSTTNQ